MKISPPLDVAKKRGWPRTTGRYRKKPVAVYAAVFNPKARYWPPKVFQRGYTYYVETANGEVPIPTGGWVVWQKVNGKFDVWPVHPDIFARTYEATV